MKIKNTKGASEMHVKALVYGASGVGKTTLARTAPRPLILSAEHGLLSLSDDDIAYVEINSFQALCDCYSELAKPELQEQFDTIVLDSLSEIVDQILGAEKASVKDGRLAYMAASDKLFKMIREFRKLPYNVIMICHEAQTDGKTHPKVHGKGSVDRLPYEFDCVWRMTIKEHEGVNYRVLLSESDGFFEAKQRGGKLKPVELADLGKVFAKILGENTKKA